MPISAGMENQRAPAHGVSRSMSALVLAVVLLLPISAEIGARENPPDIPGKPVEDYQLEGVASWYGGKFQGRLTANGEVFDTNQLTAAHRELPFGTIVRVTNTTNARTVVVRINDRGPFVDDRVIDLSRAAADLIGLTSAGIAPVTIEILHYEPESTLRTIQIASFSARPNADNLVTRLAGAGLSPAIEEVENQNVFRVVLPSVHETEVAQVRSRLASLGYGNVLVRRE
jgi:rare lipoprotein A